MADDAQVSLAIPEDLRNLNAIRPVIDENLC